jgi:SAM-dependent methyltransferase
MEIEPEAGYVRAQLRVVAVDAGGPPTGVASGSRPNWGVGQRLSGDGLLGRAVVTVEAGDRIAPGETGVVRVHPSGWEAWSDVRPGERIPMLEGPRIVAVAEVIEVVPGGSSLGRLDDPGFVREQYATTALLEARMAVWRPAVDGRTPQDVALAALAAVKPHRLLEVGSGTGAFAARCAKELGCDVMALDSSPDMVSAARSRGVDATLGDVQGLPFDDETFDAAVAAWMLYHVPDLDRAIGELARVLRRGGRLIAITNGRRQLSELYELVGAEKPQSSFSSENGAEQLERHFSRVHRVDLEPVAHFADRAAAAAYLATLGREALAARLPEFEKPLVARGQTTVFVADT